MYPRIAEVGRGQVGNSQLGTVGITDSPIGKAALGLALLGQSQLGSSWIPVVQIEEEESLDIVGTLSTTLDDVTLVADGTVVDVVASAIRVSQLPVEIVHGGESSDIRISQFVLELIQQAVAQNVSVSQLAIEFIRTPIVLFNPAWVPKSSRIIGGGLNVS
jgi:hypothetical protein